MEEERTLYRLVMRIRGFRRWLSIIYETLGERAGDECERIDDEIRERERINEKYYFEIEKPKVMKNIKEMKLEMKDFARECEERRYAEMVETVERAKSKLADMMTHRGDIEKKKSLLEDVKRLSKLVESRITQDDIDRACEYPIERLLEIKNGMAKCINHDDSRPSMNCRKNFVYCHACGYHGSAIDVFMKVNGVGFTEAVKRMTGEIYETR